MDKVITELKAYAFEWSKVSGQGSPTWLIFEFRDFSRDFNRFPKRKLFPPSIFSLFNFYAAFPDKIFFQFLFFYQTNIEY